MEYFYFSLRVMNKELEKFKLRIEDCPSHYNKLTAALHVPFDNAYNRCAFMYRYASCSMYFMQKCFSRFLSEYPKAKDVSFWMAFTEGSLCSFSSGPGLDYLALMLAFSEHEQFYTPNFDTINILSNSGAWRNTVGFVSEVISEGDSLFSKLQLNLICKNFSVIQGDLAKSFPGKWYDALSGSKVVIMFRYLNFLAPEPIEERYILNAIKDIISSLPPEAILFCIDTKPSINVFQRILKDCLGQYLYNPVHISDILPETFPEAYKAIYGCLPILSTRGAFFVWQKCSTCPIVPKALLIPFKTAESPSIQSEENVSEVIKTSVNTEDASSLTTSSNPGKDTTSNHSSVNDITQSLQSFILSNTEKLEPHWIKTAADISKWNTSMSEFQTSTENGNSLTPKTLKPKTYETFDYFTQSDAKCNNSSIIDQLSERKGTSGEEASSGYHSEVSSPLLNPLKGANSLDRKASTSKRSDNLQHSTLDWSENAETLNSKKVQTVATNKHNKTNSSQHQVNPALDTKVVETDTVHATPDNPIKLLTERIKNLVVSVKSELAQQNIPCQSNHGAMFYHDNYSSRMTHCSSTASLNCATDLAHYRNTVELNKMCATLHERDSLCSQCTAYQMNHCHQNVCCFQSCHMQHAASSCHQLHCRSGGARACLPNPTRPNIVIPLQNISNETLAQIISVLKTTTKHE